MNSGTDSHSQGDFHTSTPSPSQPATADPTPDKADSQALMASIPMNDPDEFDNNKDSERVAAADIEVQRVVVVDDHPLFRRGIVQMLDDHPMFEVRADFDHGKGLLDYVRQHPLELILLDLNMPSPNGLELLLQLRQADVTLPIVVITASEEDADLLQALANGADGYLMKDTPPGDMIDKLQRVLAGEVALNDHAITLLARAWRQSPAAMPAAGAAAPRSASHDVDLTARERQTLLLIARGLNNKLIARELGISDGTVKVYVKSLLRKLDLHSRLELAAWVHNHPDATELAL